MKQNINLLLLHWEIYRVKIANLLSYEKEWTSQQCLIFVNCEFHQFYSTTFISPLYSTYSTSYIPKLYITPYIPPHISIIYIPPLYFISIYTTTYILPLYSTSIFYLYIHRILPPKFPKWMKMDNNNNIV